MNVLNLGIISLCWSLDVMNPFLSPQLKKFGKIQLKSKLSLGLIYGLAFGFKQHLMQGVQIIIYMNIERALNDLL